MKRTSILKLCIFALAFFSLLLPTISYSADDNLYNPSQEFLQDFFNTLKGGEEPSTIETNSALALRRLHSFSDLINRNDMVSAWQTLINLPDIPGLDVITELKGDAIALQSVLPWYDDNELRSNFISAYEEIWLKSDKLENYDTFKEVFGGYASRRVGTNPAVFLRDNLGYYGYTKGPGQPAEDLMFIWELFNRFSVLAEIAIGSGYDYHALDLNLISNEIMRRTAQKIDDAWSYAVARDSARRGIVSTQKPITMPDESKTIISEEIISETNPQTPQVKKMDFSSLNIFKLPEDAGTEWSIAEGPPKDIITPEAETSTDTTPPAIESKTAAVENPLETGTGLEPPESPSERKLPSVVEIPKVDEARPPVDIPVKQEISKEEIVEEIDIGKTIPETTIPKTEEEIKTTEEKVESVFKSPKIEVVEPIKEVSIEKQEPVKMPRVDEKTEEMVIPKEEEISKEVDLLAGNATPEEKVTETPVETKTPSTETEPLKTDIKTPPAETEKIETEPTPTPPVETKKPETEIIQTPPVETKTQETEIKEPVTPSQTQPETTPPVIKDVPPSGDEEIAKIAREFTDQIISVGQDVGRTAIDLVILWSNGPEKVKDYTQQEAKLEEQFRVKKEEFLAMLFISDYFKLEEEIGMTFDTFNGTVIGALMKGFDEFKAKNGFADNPNITEEELLRAIAQLTEGVESRQESVKIKNSALRAFRLRRSQFADIITKLESLKDKKIED